MDLTRRNAEDLLKDIARLEGQLFRRYQNIIDTASAKSSPNGLRSQDDGHAAIAERNNAAYSSLRMEMDSAALVKACEDLLGISRMMKEMWVFGKLDTLKECTLDDERNQRVQEDATQVGRLLERVLARSGAEA